jgi:predicted RNase H-like HicB family nuclease
MAKLEYPVIVEPLPEADGGGFVALVPDLPGCMSDDETAEEALLPSRTQSRPGSRRPSI